MNADMHAQQRAHLRSIGGLWGDGCGLREGQLAPSDRVRIMKVLKGNITREAVTM